jgi:predicted lipase
MKTAVIFIALLLAVSQATESGMTSFLGFQMNFGPKRSIFNLLTQIEAKLKLGGPLDLITKMLEDFKTEITNEQLSHDALFAKQQQSCAEELSFRDKEIQDATGALKAGQETLDGCKSQSVRASGDLAISKKQFQETGEYLIVIQDVRKRDQYNYETQVTELNQLKSLFEECLVFIEEIFQGEKSFAELARHTNKIMKKAVSTKQISGMGALLQVMVQMASSSDLAVDEQLFQRVKELIKNQL